MTINLLYTTDDPFTATKTTTTVAAGVTIVPKANLDILSPVVVLAYNASYLGANYAYIPDLGRYYFIRDQILSPGKQIALQLNIDIRMSWDAGIRGCSGVVVRSQSIGSNYFPDDKLPVDPRRVWLESIPLAGHNFAAGSEGELRYMIAVNATY